MARKKNEPATIGDNSDAMYAATSDELRQIVERVEHLREEQRELKERENEVLAEAKGRGYDVKILRRVIARRRRDPEDVAEEEAVFDMYWDALEA